MTLKQAKRGAGEEKAAGDKDLIDIVRMVVRQELHAMAEAGKKRMRTFREEIHEKGIDDDEDE